MRQRRHRSSALEPPSRGPMGHPRGLTLSTRSILLRRIRVCGGWYFSSTHLSAALSRTLLQRTGRVAPQAPAGLGVKAALAHLVWAKSCFGIESSIRIWLMKDSDSQYRWSSALSAGFRLMPSYGKSGRSAQASRRDRSSESSRRNSRGRSGPPPGIASGRRGPSPGNSGRPLASRPWRSSRLHP